MPKEISILLTLAVIAIGAVFVSTKTTEANPPFFIQAVNTATSTFVYQTTGTTTLTLDTYNSGNNLWAADSAMLVLQVIATSTAHELRFVPYASQDGIDWYAVAQVTSANATTSPATNNYSETQWVFATSTSGIGGASVVSGSGTSVTYAATTTRLYQSFNVPTPLRFLRIAIYNPGVANQSVGLWANIYGKKQQNAR